MAQVQEQEWAPGQVREQALVQEQPPQAAWPAPQERPQQALVRVRQA